MCIYIFKVGEVQCDWVVIDVIDVVFGCLVLYVVMFLCGKYKLIFVNYIDLGDFVIIVNVDKVVFIGQKFQKKLVYCYFGYLGGLKLVIYVEFFEKNLVCVVEKVICGMFFKNSFGCQQLFKFKVYVGGEYLYVVQQFQLYIFDQVVQ